MKQLEDTDASVIVTLPKPTKYGYYLIIALYCMFVVMALLLIVAYPLLIFLGLAAVYALAVYSRLPLQMGINGNVLYSRTLRGTASVDIADVTDVRTVLVAIGRGYRLVLRLRAADGKPVYIQLGAYPARDRTAFHKPLCDLLLKRPQVIRKPRSVYGECMLWYGYDLELSGPFLDQFKDRKH